MLSKAAFLCKWQLKSARPQIPLWQTVFHMHALWTSLGLYTPQLIALCTLLGLWHYLQAVCQATSSTPFHTCSRTPLFISDLWFPLYLPSPEPHLDTYLAHLHLMTLGLNSLRREYHAQLSPEKSEAVSYYWKQKAFVSWILEYIIFYLLKSPRYCPSIEVSFVFENVSIRWNFKKWIQCNMQSSFL